MNTYYKNILIISDNEFLCSEFIKICNIKNISLSLFSFAHSPSTSNFSINNLPTNKTVEIINVKKDWKEIANKFDLIFSIHCKQLFPDKLIKNVKCINIHPGFNPYNRGWYPQVFSILNKLPLGATIHEIDEKLDHGPIISQKETPLYYDDTSFSAYNRVQNLEIKLLEENLLAILKNEYTVFHPKIDGNINLKKDFNKLLELDLNKKQTIGETIDLLRALTHSNYKNAYFVNPDTGEKVFINVQLEIINNEKS